MGVCVRTMAWPSPETWRAAAILHQSPWSLPLLAWQRHDPQGPGRAHNSAKTTDNGGFVDTVRGGREGCGAVE